MEPNDNAPHAVSKHGQTPKQALPRALGDYELFEEIGQGGTGIVYRARHREWAEMVALKTLVKIEPASVRRLQTEFRVAKSVTHENLVVLFEFVSKDVPEPFFTMKYVEGENLRSYLTTNRQQKSATTSGASPSHVAMATTITVTDGSGTDSKFANTESKAASPLLYLYEPTLEIGKLRLIFTQLAQAICALHAKKLLHRDIKPENVMIAADDRVVLLDFGLASPVRSAVGDAFGGAIVGTPVYIAPEYAGGKDPTEASDWYAFGVILHEALTGSPPFYVGSHARILKDKQEQPDPRLPPSLKVEDDVRNLCEALLKRDPSQRPSGRDVLAALTKRTNEREEQPQATGTKPLVGRQRELDVLDVAYRRSLEGRTVALHVYGSSGVGKTFLVERFLERKAEEHKRLGGSVTAARGRCYELETVPFKAFDGLVEAIAKWLGGMRNEERDKILPKGFHELVRIFPLLGTGDAESTSNQGESRPERRQEQRRRALQALKQLLNRLALDSALVLFIDDLQWSDADSIVLLNELIAPPGAVPMLLICSYRSDVGSTAPKLLAEHRRLTTMAGESLEVRDLAVGPLDTKDSVPWMRELLRGKHPDAEVDRLVNESRGIPFFIEELAHGSSSGGRMRSVADGALSLERVVMDRVDALEESARSLLNVVAVAGRPLPQGIAVRAAGVAEKANTALVTLRDANLARGKGFGNEDPIEPYHDRIRESVTASLSRSASKDIHLKLAKAFEAANQADPAILAEHYFAAEVRDKAHRFAVLAGDRAVQALSFDRAAEHFGRALECMPDDRDLLVKRADALVNAGRSAEAAPLYLDAAGEKSNQSTYLDRRRLAAEQYLLSGRIPEGTSVLQPLLSAANVKYHSSPIWALIALIGCSNRMEKSDYSFTPRKSDDVSKEDRQRIDLCWTAGKGLGSVDIMRGGYFIMRSTELALASGDSERIARGLAHIGLFSVARGGKNVAKGRALIEKAEELGKNNDYLRGFVKVNAGTGHMTLGEWQPAFEKLDEGTKILEAQRKTPVGWECSFAHSACANVLRFLGRLKDLGSLGSEWLRTAEARGDLYGGVWIRLHTSAVLLAGDDVPAARDSIAAAMASWSAKTFTPQHLVAAFLETECDLYSENPERAYLRITRACKDAKKAFALGWKNNEIQALHARGAAALALAEAWPKKRSSLLRRVKKHVQSLTKLELPYAIACSKLLEAGLVSTRGRRDEAVELLDDAILHLSNVNMKVHASAARRCRGKLLGGDAGAADIAEGDRVLHEEGVVKPELWTRMHAPGFATEIS